MVIFEYILILLAAILLSNLINRFVPVLSAPILQILLGVIIELIPFGAFGFEFKLEPELFFVLFLAPLIFYTSMNADKNTLWKIKGPIISSAVVLVILTVLGGGYFIHALIPAIPLAAAFALVAALGPTDDVAVITVGERINIPNKIMGILSGESILNDASGIMCFQFAIAAVMTSTFSFTRAVGEFLLLGVGGIAAGLIMTVIKYALVKWLRSLGIENVTLHILIGLLTPFIIYIAAESFSVSGIFAVFASGIAHSFARDKLNPERVNLNIALDSVWSVLAFTFEGLVFVMLGTQLPGILETIGEYAESGWQIALYILLLTLMLMVFRFVWWIFAVRKKTYQDSEKPVGKIKSGVIFCLAGARGTVTLASVMSIPLLLADGSYFPERDLIILLASGVIVVSLLMTNFILPLFAERKTEKARNEMEQAAYAEIIHQVMTRLMSEATDENRMATDIVVRSYFSRNASSAGHKESAEEHKLAIQALLWEKENTIALKEKGAVDGATADHFLDILDVRLESKGRVKNFLRRIMYFYRNLLRIMHFRKASLKRDRFMTILYANSQFVLDKLKEIRNETNAKEVDKFISSYELSSAALMGRGARHSEVTESLHHKDRNGGNAEGKESLYQVAVKGFQIERELIQEMFEAGRISRETAREMRGNIATLEARLEADSYLPEG